MDEIKEIFKDNRFALSLTLIAFTIWLSSVPQARTNLFAEGIGDLGLITILPVTYFIAFSLLTISFLIALKSEKKNEMLLFLQGCSRRKRRVTTIS
ncbi:hypothetical protein FHEFKHOI_01326 [Candidatus Methanoperedenaceae archaeon GB50]|nr:hypothetical protein FHEFKHOI_01326 [Candidatus Methanoperedenaceae archaeon GB50]CAD7780906.1 MAG: hypothetical protein KBONHNOK_01549 [Candidatus Methanoperedenaceae archaeon GB50]